MAGPAPGRSCVAHDGGARGGEDARADGGADAERREVPLAERALEAAALEDVVLAILDGLPEEQPAHESSMRGPAVSPD